MVKSRKSYKKPDYMCPPCIYCTCEQKEACNENAIGNQATGTVAAHFFALLEAPESSYH